MLFRSEAPMLQAPALHIELTGTNLVLSWIGEAGEFSLQSRTNLISGTTWAAVTNSVMNTFGTNQVIVAPDASANFFRLAQTNSP